MNEKKRLIKNTGIIAIGNISTKLVSFFLLPLYTTLLSASEYGVFDYILSIATFCVPFVSVLMDESIFRFLIDCKKQEEKEKVISTSLIIVLTGMTGFDWYSGNAGITLSLYLLCNNLYFIKCCERND